jgi:hypothetical protein
MIMALRSSPAPLYNSASQAPCKPAFACLTAVGCCAVLLFCCAACLQLEERVVALTARLQEVQREAQVRQQAGHAATAAHCGYGQ